MFNACFARPSPLASPDMPSSRHMVSSGMLACTPRSVCHRQTAEQKFKCLNPCSRASRSSLIQGGCLRLGGDPITNSGRSACNVFQHSCRPAAEAKSIHTAGPQPHLGARCSPTSPNALARKSPDIRFCHMQRTSSLTCLQTVSTASSSSRGCSRASSAVRTPP